METINNPSWDMLRRGDVVHLQRKEHGGVTITSATVDYLIPFFPRFLVLKESSRVGKNVKIDQAAKEWELKKISRSREYTPVLNPSEYKYTMAAKGKAIDNETFPLTERARIFMLEQHDYWMKRINGGDPLFDQWMVDAKNDSKIIYENIEKILKSGSLENKSLRGSRRTDTISDKKNDIYKGDKISGDVISVLEATRFHLLEQSKDNKDKTITVVTDALQRMLKNMSA